MAVIISDESIWLFSAASFWNGAPACPTWPVDRAKQVSHSIGLHPQNGVESRDREHSGNICAVLIRGAVQSGGAKLLDDLK
jgi:hypothetical protein